MKYMYLFNFSLYHEIRGKRNLHLPARLECTPETHAEVSAPYRLNRLREEKSVQSQDMQETCAGWRQNSRVQKNGKNQAEQRRFPILRQSMKHSPGQRTENPSPRYQRGPPDRKKRLSRLLSKDNDKKNQRGFKKVIKVLKQKYGNPRPPICS